MPPGNATVRDADSEVAARRRCFGWRTNTIQYTPPRERFLPSAKVVAAFFAMLSRSRLPGTWSPSGLGCIVLA
jgi:hypothetical protein